jgi:tetratricopeptide (TPR) repeat protein
MASSVLDRALAINPNAATAWMVRGWFHALHNQPEAAIEACDWALRLSPLDPLSYWTTGGIALAHLYARRFEEAIEWADRTLRDQPRAATAIWIKIAASAHLGRLDEARADLGRLLAIDPRLTISRYRALLGPATAPEALDLAVAGLRLAGLPEK